MTDSENGLLHKIKDKLDDVHDESVRGGEQIRQMNGRIDRLDKNVDLLRNGWQNTAQEVALVKQECVRRSKELSREHKRIDTLEKKAVSLDHTGKVQIIRAKTTWQTLVIVGAVAAGVVSMALTVWKFWGGG